MPPVSVGPSSLWICPYRICSIYSGIYGHQCIITPDYEYSYRITDNIPPMIIWNSLSLRFSPLVSCEHILYSLHHTLHRFIFPAARKREIGNTGMARTRTRLLYSCFFMCRVLVLVLGYGYAVAARPITLKCPRDQVRQGLKIADCNRSHR